MQTYFMPGYRDNVSPAMASYPELRQPLLTEER